MPAPYGCPTLGDTLIQGIYTGKMSTAVTRRADPPPSRNGPPQQDRPDQITGRDDGHIPSGQQTVHPLIRDDAEGNKCQPPESDLLFENICQVCDGDTAAECLKCRKCKKYTHYLCSELPTYAIVNFANTRSQYSCRNCVVAQFGQELISEVVSVVKKEQDIKAMDRSSSSTWSDERTNDLDDDTEGVGSPHPKPTTCQTPPRKSTKICSYYKRNKCKFGLKGLDCPYTHPKLCNKYWIGGLDAIKGCNKGANCKFFHPPICYGSESRRECLKAECRRL